MQRRWGWEGVRDAGGDSCRASGPVSLLLFCVVYGPTSPSLIIRSLVLTFAKPWNKDLDFCSTKKKCTSVLFFLIHNSGVPQASQRLS